MDPSEIVARIGGENAPTLDELREADTELTARLKEAAATTPPDLEAMQSLRAGVNSIRDAIRVEEEAEAAVAEEAAALLKGLDGDDEPAEEADPDTETAEVEDRQPVAASLLPVADAVARIKARSVTPVPEAVTHSVVTASGELDGSGFGLWQAADEFTRRQSRLGKRDTIISVQTSGTSDRDLRGAADAGDVTRMLSAVIDPAVVTAAGGCCSLGQPLYDQNILARTDRPIRDALPSFSATRGAVSFFPPVCLPQAGVGIWTCEQDELVDPNDPATWKVCVDVECPTEVTETVEAIYHCLNIGVWQRRFAPEQWAAILNALQAQQARIADSRLFALLRDRATTTHTVADEGGFWVTFFSGIGRAAAQIRQDQRYPQGLNLRLVAAEWVRDALRDDLNRPAEDDRVRQVTDAQITEWLARSGVVATWSPDVDPIHDESPGQVDGPLEEFPALASAVLFAEGDHVFLDGGEYNLGTEIVDSDNARQNRISAFAESFEGLISRPCNAKALDFEVNVAGSCCVTV